MNRHSNPSIQGFLILGALVCAVLTAENSTYYQFRYSAKSNVCRNRLDTLKATQKVFEDKAFAQFVRKGSTKALVPAMAGWSTDFLIKVALELDQDYRVLCPEHKPAQQILAHVRKAYLAQLGFNPNQINDYQAENLFKGLLAFKDEVPQLKGRLMGLRSARPNPDEILPALFGPIKRIKGVNVYGARPFEADRLANIVNDVCKNLPACPFWDNKLLYKVVIRNEPMAAMYVPEVGVLVLSRELFRNPNPLHNIVVLHELAHVAAHGAWVYQRADWMGEFAKLSGWQKGKDDKWFVQTRRLAGTRTDTLTKLSEDSPFSILPDAIYVGEAAEKAKKGKKAKPGTDGFVLGKSYEESIRNNDPSEDFADHVAIFHYFPKRYCFQGKNVAPQKYAWIAKNIFRKPTSIDCKEKKKKSTRPTSLTDK